MSAQPHLQRRQPAMPRRCAFARVAFLSIAVVMPFAGAPARAASTPAGPTQPARRYAPLDQPGPPLDVSPPTVRTHLACSHPSAPRGRPILLVPGTGTIPSIDYGWNYEPAFSRRNFAWCALTLPDSANTDIQRAGEYVVAAIRIMSAASRQKIDIVGWSQGGMVPRWALRFWPDTRTRVANVIGLAPSNHGTTAVNHVCRQTCLPALRQQGTRSRFIAALNSSAETFGGIAYTNIYTRHDDIVIPNLDATGSSSLHTGDGIIANVALQDACPTNTARHFAIGTYDPVGYALVIDALTHSGHGASAGRIPLATCRQQYQPGVEPKTFARNFAALNAYVASHKAVGGFTAAEPPLAAYVFAARQK